jgi:hypothetical protein
VRISVSADELTGIADALAGELQRRGHEVIRHGVLADGERADWAWASERVARDVADGRTEILDAWFAGEPGDDAEDRANVERLAEIERDG